MTSSYKTKFTDSSGKTFIVNEVIQTPVGLTVYYENEISKEKYSCLLDAFTQRFRELIQ